MSSGQLIIYYAAVMLINTSHTLEPIVLGALQTWNKVDSYAQKRYVIKELGRVLWCLNLSFKFKVLVSCCSVRLSPQQ